MLQIITFIIWQCFRFSGNFSFQNPQRMFGVELGLSTDRISFNRGDLWIRIRIWLLNSDPVRFEIQVQLCFSLVMVGGGGFMCPRFFIYFLIKISTPDQTLRPTCKFLILGIFTMQKKNSSNLVYEKFYYINL